MTDEHFIYIERWNICYARVPKVANTSIKTILAQALGLDHDKFKPTNDRFWRNRESEGVFVLNAETLVLRHPSAFTFAFVRDPADRLASFYSANILRWKLSDHLASMGFTKEMGADAFVDKVAQTPDHDADIHFVAQSSILTLSDRVVPQFVGKIESMNAEWNRLRSILEPLRGLDLPEMIVTNRVKRTADQDAFERPALHSKIRIRYRVDYDNFYPDQVSAGG